MILKNLGIETHSQPTAYLHKDCAICRSEGFNTHARVQITTSNNSIVTSLNIVHSDLISPGEVGLSIKAWVLLNPKEGEKVTLSHPRHVESMSYVRAKIFGTNLNEYAFYSIINDIHCGLYSNIQISAFLTACADNKLETDEIYWLTKAMVNIGKKLEWPAGKILDKHCVGGLPGNRTTPIIVSILAAAGLIVPKTSSRAITSPSGSADTMQTMTEVALTIEKIKAVVEKEGGCFAWGGAVSLSPVDNVLIPVEKALDLDSEGQLIASVLSKKIAAGATHILLDIPVGETAKIRTKEQAQQISKIFHSVAKYFDINIEIYISDGSQPIGNGIGPALEARDVLSVLKNNPEAPQDLKEKSLICSAKLLLMGDVASTYSEAMAKATEIIESGQAWDKFLAICNAQGGFNQPPIAPYQHDIRSSLTGTVSSIDNRQLARIAKLAGAPEASAAGIDFLISIGQQIKKDDVLFRIHAQSTGELNYALEYYKEHPNIIRIN